MILVIFVVVLIIMSGCSSSTSDIEKYGHYDYSVGSSLQIFPEKDIMNNNVEHYKYTYGTFLTKGNSIYLKCRFDNTTFNSEIERIKKLSAVYDKNLFKTPAYIMIYQKNSEYEAALVSIATREITYFYVNHYDKMKEYIPEDIIPNSNNETENFDYYSTN